MAYVYGEAVTLCKAHNLINGHAFGSRWQKTAKKLITAMYGVLARLKTFLLSLTAADRGANKHVRCRVYAIIV